MAEIATVTSKGQVTLPASVRRRMGIQEGSRLVFLEADGELRVLKEGEIDTIFKVFDDRRRELGLKRKDVERLVSEARERVWRRHYARRR